MANPKVCPPVTANSDSLPEDLIIDILLRLPVKCLLRFRAVSKTWLSLLSSPSFIGWHAITNTKNDNTFIVHRLKENDHSQVSLVHLDSHEIGADLELPYSKVVFSFPPRLLLVGSCNGIICAVVPNYSASFPAYVNSYRYQNHNTYLWNPVTKHSKLLPPHTTRENRDIRSMSLGFGFDPIGNDYKVVCTVAVRGKLLRAEVYSSNRNGWRKIEPNTMAIPNSRTFDVCLNGFLYCTSDLQVMTFDLNKEVFNYDTYFPPEIKDKLFFGYRVITLEDDSLGVIMHGEDFFDGLIRLWRVDAAASIRAGTGTGGAWTPMFIVETTLDKRWIHGYINNGDILIKEYGDKWVLYNADKKEKLNFLIGKSEIFKYTESLVSIAGFKQIKRNAEN